MNRDLVRKKAHTAYKTCLVFLLIIAVTLGIGPQGVYAKTVGQKNDEQYQAVNRVATGSTPAGYEDVNNDKSVMRGADAVSATTAVNIDSGPNTFADVLPYGDIY